MQLNLHVFLQYKKKEKKKKKRQHKTDTVYYNFWKMVKAAHKVPKDPAEIVAQISMYNNKCNAIQ